MRRARRLGREGWGRRVIDAVIAGVLVGLSSAFAVVSARFAQRGRLLSFAVGEPERANRPPRRRLRIRRFLRRRDLASLDHQLVTAASGIGAALRAGLSLSQAVRFAAAESEPPLADALRGVTGREDLGLALEESLERWATSSSSADVRLLASALSLRIGSGLPRVLDEVCRALRQRATVAREVRSLTAQARLSGTILGFLPIWFFLFLVLTSPGDMAAAFGAPAGIAAITCGLVLQAGGFLWIRRLLRVEAS
jgi:tight adherence protein B